MNNRKHIPRSQLLYPHVVKKSDKGLYFVLNTANPSIDIVGYFKTKKDAIAEAYHLNHLHLDSTGWYQREKKVRDTEKPHHSLALVLVLFLVLVLCMRLISSNLSI